MIDWFACMGVAALFFNNNSWAILGVFAIENIVLVGLLGYTLGHRLLGIQVRSLSGRPVVGLVASTVRTLLLCAVIPAVVWDADGRSLHDKAAGTAIVRR